MLLELPEMEDVQTCPRARHGRGGGYVTDHSEGHDGYYFPDTEDFFCLECEDWVEGGP